MDYERSHYASPIFARLKPSTRLPKAGPGIQPPATLDDTAVEMMRMKQRNDQD